ncbi:MAG: diguanylate cyclase [Desulfurivibrio sp.]|nr:diguanylate cyclase [Desulfurivibrio sp.]
MSFKSWLKPECLPKILTLPFSHSLRAFLFSRFIGVALVIFVVVLGTATVLYDRLITNQARTVAKDIAAHTYTTINALMPHGPSREELTTVIDEIRQAYADTPYEIKVYRSPLVDELYGEIEQHSSFKETVQQKGLAPGYGQQSTTTGDITRHLYPLRVDDASCLSCHPNAEMGSVLGIVEVKQNIAEMTARMRGQYLWLFVLYGLLTIALVVGITTLVVNRISTVIAEFRKKTAAIKTVTDLPTLSQLGQSSLGFSELTEAFRAVGELSTKLHEIAVDKDELQAAHDKLDKLVSLNADGIMVMDKHGVIKFINPAAAAMLGRTENDLLGQQFGYPLTTKKNTEIELLSKNNTLVGVELRTQETEWNNQPALLTSFRNITDRKLAEQALRENEEELGAMYENAPLIMMLADQDCRIRKANPYTGSFFGLSMDNILNSRLDEILTCPHCNDCGSGPHCHLCAFHSTTKETFATGKSFNQVEVHLSLKQEEKQRDLTFLASTSLLQHKEKPLILIVLMDITKRKEAEAHLEHISFHDTPTGLYNRNFFEEEMKRLADGRHIPVGLVICDLDGLKLINDSLGHQAGDELISNTAHILKQSFRTSDIVARIGGDEFAVLLPETPYQKTREIAQRLRDYVEDHNNQDPRIPISLSVGFAVANSSPVDMQALFSEADDRMYREKIQTKKSSQSVAVRALTKALGARDFITEGHSQRLQELMTSLARAAAMDEDDINDLVLLAQFHDLGKISVPDRILFKDGPLTEEEMTEMRRHSEIGYEIALSVPNLQPIAEWILLHHERWDGKGYPRGLAGHDIPLPCRILAIADAHDAMVNDRPYRQAMSYQQAVEELRRCAGTQFDPDLVAKYIHIME